MFFIDCANKMSLLKNLNLKRICLINCVLIMSFLSPAFSAEREKYLHFTDIDGLPRNIVTGIEQDKYGYTWVGTGNGIARYDGNAFTVYDQLKGQTINHLYIDRQNNLWLASDQGLYFYNRITDFFEIRSEGYIRTIKEDKGEIYFILIDRIKKLSPTGTIDVILDNDLRDFCFTEEGIWYCNSYAGIKLLSRISGFHEITENYLKGKYVSVIRKIDDKLFFGCRNGQIFSKKIDSTPKEVEIENHYNCQEIIKVGNEYWLATDGNGIIILDSDLNYLRSLNKGSNQGSRLSSNSIYDIYPGSNDEIWIATYGAGLICLLADDSPFNNILPEPGNMNSLVAKEGASVYSKNKKIYYGTNYGLSIFDESSGKYINFSMEQLIKDLNGAKVLAINTDQHNNLWVGTYDGLMGKYSSDLKLLGTYHPCSDSTNEMQRITLIHNYRNTNLLIGTHYRDRSLLNFDLQSERVTPLKINMGGEMRTNFQIISIRENREGETLALIRNAGLYSVNLEKNVLENDLPEINKRVTFRLNDFYADKNGYYWMTSQKDGLIRMSADGLEFDKWTTEQGLPTNSLLRIESVDDEYLWISSIAGLCRFQMKTGQVSIYNYRHGLSANEFTDRTSTTTNDGRLVFGFSAGFTIIEPDKVQADVSKTEVIISDITFQNQSIKRAHDKQYLTVPLEETKELSLPFRRNSFTIYFFSKDMDLPKYNNYAYRLVGFENDWIYLGETKHTTYTNLSPGTYTFEVKSTNKSNVWSDDPTRLIIHINPPWYLSWYAYSGYVILIISIVYFSMKVYANRLLLKKEVEMSEYNVLKEHELTEKKLAFFTNISHDLRTPLTLIDAPVNDLLQSDNLNPDQINKLSVIKRNSKRLYNLISDLLDFRKLTQKQILLHVSETNISEVVANIYEAFKEECKNKSIEFLCGVTVEKAVYVDAKKIEKILWNLLSNALKFTEKEGEIYLSVEEEIHEGLAYLKMQVKDTGKGIEEENIENIFNRFYQVHDTKSGMTEGTGIGLSIVKDLVELHHGEITVESVIGVGTTFRIRIPAEMMHYSEVELHSVIGSDQLKIREEHPVKNDLLPNDPKQIRYNLPKILIVEDNLELLHYLADHFAKYYKVYQAIDGVQGLELARGKTPDIIVTDILMPNMNGYDFCKEIKKQFEISHIPVIMLTANSAVEQQIEGLETGAEAFVTKPFDINYLDSLINTILENRKKLRDKFTGIDLPDDQEHRLPQKDVIFIDELKEFIELNIADQQLSVELLSAHFAISRTQLNRKINSLMGKTPNNLIKTIRLKKAYELIRHNGVRVSEAAYMTGFTDPNYFTLCFKKEFGENPSKIG